MRSRERSPRLYEAEHELQLKLQDLSVEDPLGEYFTFLLRFRDNISSQFYMHVLKCVNHFQNEDRYKNDTRLVSLWLVISKTPEHYKTMARFGAGLLSPAYYTAYSRCLATLGYFDSACKVLDAGVAACGELPFTIDHLRAFLPEGGPIDDPSGDPLPTTNTPPQTAEVARVDINLLYENGTERTFKEVMMEARKVTPAPTPRRPNPHVRTPPPPPQVPTSDKMELYNYADPAARWQIQAAETQLLKSRYAQQHLNGSFGGHAQPDNRAGSNSSSSVSSNGSGATAANGHGAKLLQYVNFDLEPVPIVNQNISPPVDLPPVIDASVDTTRRLFVPTLNAALKQMQNVFIQNPITNQGYSYLTKRPNLPEQLSLTNITITVRKVIGSGGYGTVFSAINSSKSSRYALKLEKGNIPWEWYVVSVARSRLREERALQSIIHCFYYEGFKDEQYMLMPLIGYDSLLTIANYIRSRQLSTGHAEIIAAYFSVELLRTVRSLHSNGIIHGDLKAENVMLRAPADKSIHSGHLGRTYMPDGSDNWLEYGVVLIDFGRSIDLELFPRSQQFEATWSVDSDQDCWEMCHGMPWTYQPDYFGIASIAHLLLFGKYVKLKTDGGHRHISEPYKRTMHNQMWDDFFNVLLNPDPSRMPIVDELARLQSTLETYLSKEAGHNKLHHIITDIAYDVRRKRLI